MQRIATGRVPDAAIASIFDAHDKPNEDAGEMATRQKAKAPGNVEGAPVGATGATSPPFPSKYELIALGTAVQDLIFGEWGVNFLSIVPKTASNPYRAIAMCVVTAYARMWHEGARVNAGSRQVANDVGGERSACGKSELHEGQVLPTSLTVLDALRERIACVESRLCDVENGMNGTRASMPVLSAATANLLLQYDAGCVQWPGRRDLKDKVIEALRRDFDV